MGPLAHLSHHPTGVAQTPERTPFVSRGPPAQGAAITQVGWPRRLDRTMHSRPAWISCTPKTGPPICPGDWARKAVGASFLCRCFFLWQSGPKARCILGEDQQHLWAVGRAVPSSASAPSNPKRIAREANASQRQARATPSRDFRPQPCLPKIWPLMQYLSLIGRIPIRDDT